MAGSDRLFLPGQVATRIDFRDVHAAFELQGELPVLVKRVLEASRGKSRKTSGKSAHARLSACSSGVSPLFAETEGARFVAY
jgi:hypothetical protein